MGTPSQFHSYIQTAVTLLVMLAVITVYVGDHVMGFDVPEIEKIELSDLDADAENEVENEFSPDFILYQCLGSSSERKLFSLLAKEGNEHVQFLHRTIEVITPPPEMS